MTSTGVIVDAVTCWSSRSDRADSQDRAGTFQVIENGACGVVVCDGVGARPDSVAAAAHVVDTVTAQITRHGLRHVPAGLQEAARTMPGTLDGATTAILVGIEPDGSLHHALLGNGALIEIAPLEAPDGHPRIRWNEIAVPQYSLAMGRPTLTGYVEPTRMVGHPECGVRLRVVGPRLFLACTDGITTQEDRPIARLPDADEHWQVVPAPLARLLEHIRGAWFEIVADRNGEALQRTLDVALQTALDAGALTDDATVGAVLVSGPVDAV